METPKTKMNAEEFQNLSCSILKTVVGWQTKIAKKLDVDRRTVRRWIEQDAVPEFAQQLLLKMVNAEDLLPWPRDEWLIGDTIGQDGRMRTYIYHMQPPRFIARVVDVDHKGDHLEEENPVNVYAGITYGDVDQVLCEISWIDQIKPGEVTQLLEAAMNFINIYDYEIAIKGNTNA